VAKWHRGGVGVGVNSSFCSGLVMSNGEWWPKRVGLPDLRLKWQRKFSIVKIDGWWWWLKWMKHGFTVREVRPWFSGGERGGQGLGTVWVTMAAARWLCGFGLWWFGWWWLAFFEKGLQDLLPWWVDDGEVSLGAVMVLNLKRKMWWWWDWRRHGFYG
jgi:hypothetical protein